MVDPILYSFNDPFLVQEINVGREIDKSFRTSFGLNNFSSSISLSLEACISSRITDLRDSINTGNSIEENNTLFMSSVIKGFYTFDKL